MPVPTPRLIPLLALALLLRIAWAVSQPLTAASIDRLPDQREYLSLARNLLQHGTLSFVDPRFEQEIYAYRMPGYPLFLTACGASVLAARIAQAVMDVSTVLAVFLIARKLSDQTSAFLAAGLMVVNPFSIYFSGLILTETLFCSLLTWAVWLLVSRRWIAGLVCLVGGCFLKPTGLLLATVISMAAANCASAGSYRLWGVCRSGLISTSLTFVCLFPWAWRNHQRLGAWIFTTTNAGVTLYDGFHPGATGGSDQRFVTYQPGLKSINEVDRSRFFQDQAKQWISRHWRETPALSARKIARGWSPLPLSAEFGRPMYRLISAVYCVPFDLLCLLGLFSRRLSGKAKLLLVSPALVVTLAQILSVGSIRYRMPAEAPAAVLAAAGCSGLLQRRKFEVRNLE